MPTGQRIDGKAIAQKVRHEIKDEVTALSKRIGTTPHLVVVLASDDPASAIYVRNKAKACAEVGIRSTQHNLPADASPETVLDLVKQLNEDPDVDGILVQLPLPKQHDEERVIRSIDPDKDVDGLHPLNAGKLSRGDENCLIPCTPKGCIRLIEEAGVEIKGKRAVVLGRSRLVGRPVADLRDLLTRRHGTMTDYRVTDVGIDRIDAAARCGDLELRLSLVAVRDEQGWADEGRVLVGRRSIA